MEYILVILAFFAYEYFILKRDIKILDERIRDLEVEFDNKDDV